MEKLAVIYANESNIWDKEKKQFHYFRNERKSIDEMSFAMPISEAKEVLKSINDQRQNEVEETGEHIDEAYISEIPSEEEEKENA